MGSELWKSDGTDLTTLMVKDIYYPEGVSSSPAYLASNNNMILFSAYTSDKGREVWKTDGTDEGTIFLLDIKTGSQSSDPAEFISLGDQFLFSATGSSNGKELYITDGTVPGTHLLKDIRPGSNSSSPSKFTLFDEEIFFSAIGNGIDGTELWKSDGTDAGTILVKNIHATGNSSPKNLIAAGSNLFFTANDGINGRELWKSDGTNAGTVLVKIINPATDITDPFTEFYALGNSVYFIGDDGIHGAELWISDGSEAGTILLKDIFPGANNSDISFFGVLDGILYFSANDGSNGEEIWSTDGTPAGTIIFNQLIPGADAYNLYSGVQLNDIIYFGGGDDRLDLYRTDGTIAGTYIVKDISFIGAGSGQLHLFSKQDGLIYFSDEGETSAHMWQSDGTEAGTVMLDNPDNISAEYDYLYAAPVHFINDLLVFPGNSLLTGSELFKYTVGSCSIDTTITPSGELSFCNGSTVTLSAQSGYLSYQWFRNGNPIAGANSFQYTVIKTGNYFAEMQNGDCIENSQVIVVTVYPKPNAIVNNIDATNDLCFDPSIKLKANTVVGASYQWFKDGSPIAGANSQLYFVTAPGTYNVKLTTAFGCSKISTGYIIIESCRLSNEFSEYFIYPNPASDKLFINAENCNLVEIFDTAGKLVIGFGANSPTTEIDLKDIAEGFYIVKLNLETGVAYKRLVIAK
jgi:ELWxxDGT repeat protein